MTSSFPVVIAQSNEAPPALVEPDLLARAEGGRGRSHCPGRVRGRAARGSSGGSGSGNVGVCDVVEGAVGGDQVDAGVLAGPG